MSYFTLSIFTEDTTIHIPILVTFAIGSMTFTVIALSI